MPPEIDETNRLWKVYAWKGERKSTQLVLWSSADKGKLSFEWSDFISQKGIQLAAECFKARSEIDFLIQYSGQVIPVEVKAEENLQAKSLNTLPFVKKLEQSLTSV